MMTFTIIIPTFKALKFLLSFCAVIVFANLFYENVFPSFFVNFLLLN